MKTTRIERAISAHAGLAAFTVALMSLLPGGGAHAATATVEDIGKIAGSQQITIPATNRAYEKPAATSGSQAADPLKEGYCRSALPVVFGTGAAEIMGPVTQDGTVLYAPATVGGAAVTLACTINNLNAVQKIVASYNAGPAFQDPNIRGLFRDQDPAGLYIPDPIRNQAKLDTYTALLGNGQVTKISLGFVAAAGWTLLDDAGLTLKLKDITFVIDHETKKLNLGGTLGGSLIAGPSGAEVTFAVLGSLDKNPKNFSIVGTAEKIDFIAMMKAMAPKGAFRGLPVPIDVFSQFARVDLAKLTVKPLARDVNFYATAPLVGVEFSFKPNEVVPVVEEPPLSTYVTGAYGAGSGTSGFTTSLTGGYTGKAASPPPPADKPAPKPTSAMGFMLGIEPAPGFKIGEMVPELSVIDRIRVVNAAFVYSTFRGEAQPDTNLAVFKNWSPTTKIGPGFTALAVAEIAKLADVLEAMKFDPTARAAIVESIRSGLPVKNAVFMANVPKTPADFRLKLLANLATPRILGVLDFRDVDVEMQPASTSPAISLGGTVDLKLPDVITTSERLVFNGRVGYEAPTTGFMSLASKEDIKDVFGFKGLRIGKAAISAGVKFHGKVPLPDNMELTGGIGLTVNKRQVFRDVSMTGAFDTSDLKKLAIRFNVEQLDWKNFVMAFGGPKVFDKLPPAADRALNTELRDLLFQLAMPGMTFTSATGQSFTGMHVLGRGKIAGIAGDFDAMLEGFDKGFAISAAMDKLKLPKAAGIETLVLQSYDGKAGPQAAVNLTLANLIGGAEPLIRIDGDMILLGAQSRTTIVLAHNQFEGTTQGKIYGVLDGELSFTAPSFANPQQEMRVKAAVDTQALGAKIMRTVTQGLSGVNFTLKEFAFEGALGALQAGATADILLSVKPQNMAAFDHRMKVKIEAKDGAAIVEKIAAQLRDELAALATNGWKGVTTAVGAVADTASKVPGFLKTGWAKTGGALINAVESLFDKDGRKRIKVDGPKFRLHHRATNMLLRPLGIDGKSGASLVRSQGANAFEEEWQLVPSSEDGFHYLVTGWDGQNINVRGASKDENAEIWIQQHRDKNKANEKVELVAAEGDWYFLRFKHSGKFVYGPGAGARIVQSSRQDAGAMWRFEPDGIKVWDKSGPGSVAAAPADGVVVFVLENYQGNWLALHEGKNQLGAPFGNAVASVRLPAGYTVTLFDKVDCSAKHLSLKITSSASNLKGSGLSGDVACVTVEKTTTTAAAAPSGSVVRLFLQPSFQGVSFDAGEGTYPLEDPFRNKVRSVRMNSALTATLVNKIDCVSGGSLLLTSDTASLAGQKFDLPNGKKGSGVENNAACVIVKRKATTAATVTTPAPAPTPSPAPQPAPTPTRVATGPSAGAAASLPPSGVVELFVDKNYSGAALKLAATGQPFALPDLYRNKVSSLRVPAGMSAELFDKVDCNVKNKHKVFTANTPSLEGTGLNDDVACIIVREQTEPVRTY